VAEVVQVRLREAGKVFYYETGNIKVHLGDTVIVEQDRGLEYGEVVSEPETVSQDAIAPGEEPIMKIVRMASPDDINQIAENKKKAKETAQIAEKKIQERELPMKLVDTEYSFDRSKIIFYFTSESRVDFRELVKELAHAFKARIELKQIGVRDEARMFGGFGCCGRQLCCATFLKDFQPVTIRMAKEQNLPLNPAKISGICGRLMCCLAYESCTYREMSKGLPRMGETVNVNEGHGKVIEINVLKRCVTVDLGEGKKTVVCYNKCIAPDCKDVRHAGTGTGDS
jgi:cell fate regulator YaaT (PSP1 superfamily)